VRQAIILVSLAPLVVSCSTSAEVGGTGDVGVEEAFFAVLGVPEDFGDPCVENLECESGWCIEGPQGDVCTMGCTQGCPPDHDCKLVIAGNGTSVSLCVPRIREACALCGDDGQCDGGAGVCLTLEALDIAGRCAYPCESDQACTDGFACLADPTGKAQGTYCLPQTLTCTCHKGTPGAMRSCVTENLYGKCFGVETCKTSAGWTPCTAKEPASETCDGRDEDCNGVIDDPFLGIQEPCQNQVEGVGSCDGVRYCLGAVGWYCQGPIPTPEVCDGQDNNCDGATDEGFKDAGGAWTLDADCGYCQNDCTHKVSHGTGKCGGPPESPVCVVSSCDAGYVQVNDYQCLPPSDLTCLPCASDAECLGGLCVPLEGQQICGMPCDFWLTGCDPGYTCTDLGSGESVCLPASGTCSCTPATHGAKRACSKAAAVGTCYGLETCDSLLGWGGCTATVPGPEACNGVDDDCNGLPDDGLAEQGAACQNVVPGVGGCDGIRACLGPLGWVCQGPVPLPEVCDFADNDCDGLADEDFKSPTGTWTLPEHCGSCGHDCAAKVVGGIGTCGTDPASPFCVVESCNQGLVQINDFQCIEPPEVSCQPCATDASCFGGTCLEVDGAKVCAVACPPSGKCGPGYACEALSGGELRCLPTSGSCACGEATAGIERACVSENPHGTCLGLEVCDPMLGWAGCTAKVAAPEACNGLDDDCDGIVDDGLFTTAPCAIEVAGVGSCAGVEVCSGAAGLACLGQKPAPESCNFLDDDCDGKADEDFKDAQGNWTLTAHCGSCGNPCQDKFPHATGVCTGLPESPYCSVGACDPGYVQVSAFQCALPVDVSCQPCLGDADCYDGSCVILDGQHVCVMPCPEPGGGCADGYGCEAVYGGQERCLPVTGSCVCSATTAGQKRTCLVQNLYGTCFGQEACDAAAGWAGCTAVTPAVEACNGLDDDCDGLADDGVTQPAAPCAVTSPAGTCTGSWTCGSGTGGAPAWWCSAATPATDACDYLDNDCDGLVDEDFRPGDPGPYVDDAHCGACGVSCQGAIPDATAHCVLAGASPRCEVAACDPGTYQAGPLTCLAATDDICTPCKTDASCPTPGDACLALEGGSFCGRDCGAGNVHGTPAGECPAGFGCAEIGDGVSQCLPLSGSCACLAGDAGEKRGCLIENQTGVCFGEELCDPVAGWVECDAATPAPEVCDGWDTDCNGPVDDADGRGQACAITNPDGSCPGVMDCVAGQEALACVGKTPALDVCDHADNDCDGQVDQAYRTNGDGPYVHDEHCGACGVSCQGAVPNATAQCVLAGTTPRCEVAACDPGYYPVGVLACLEATDDMCTPCKAGGSCQTPGDACLTIDGGSYCGRDCGAGNLHGTPAGECPAGYQCASGQCVPLSGSCSCLADHAGETRSCQVKNQAGTCFGVEACDPAEGWVGCDAATPAPEVCDAADTDCNGPVDDVAGRGGACSLTSPDGSCPGVLDCVAGNPALVCVGTTPAPEVCDYQDNNCDGTADEPYRQGGTGSYLSDAHCGACGVSCQGAIPSATATCKLSGGKPRCEVASCDPGYWKAGPLTCLPATDDTCDPCITDANCPTPGDTCLSLDGSTVCGYDCGAGNLHGTSEGSCPAGFGCVLQANGTQQCQPVSGSCACLAGDAGEIRACIVKNQTGVCFGQETCHPAQGWEGCDAATPAAEVCDGADSDCDAKVDDVPGRGDPCTLTNLYGSCPGLQECVGGFAALQCLGQTPAAESCNYLDDNCNGSTDEGFAGLGTPCTAGLGVCARVGVLQCKADGSATTCSAVAGPPDAGGEVCDGLDNDCNGTLDDDLPPAPLCPLQKGVCSGSTELCAGQLGYFPCGPATYGLDWEPLEASCDGADNDCNGTVDDVDLDRDSHRAIACGGDDCDDQNSGVHPDQDELCGNAVDEDCSTLLNDRDVDQDSSIDGDVLCGGTDCQDGDPLVRPGAPEYRDGKDNDCDADGKADEGLVAAGDVVVTEIMYDPSGSPDENFEWFEVFNATTRPIGLATWSVQDDPGASQEVTVIDQPVVVGAKDFAVLCRAASVAESVGVACADQYGFFQLGNGPDEIVLVSGATTVDLVAYKDGASGWANAQDESLNLDGASFAADNNLPANWCLHPLGGPVLTSGDEASPGVANVRCTGAVTAPVLAAVDPAFGVAAGGASIRLVGSGFTGTTQVTVGGTPCAPWTVVSNNQATCTVPAGSPGSADVVVTESALTATLAGAFTWTGEAAGAMAIDSAGITSGTTSRMLRGTWSPALRAEFTEPGVTGVGCPAGGELAPGVLRVEVGSGPAGSDPRQSGAWRWIPAFCESQAGASNTFVGSVTVATPGTYAVAFRASRDNGVLWTYADTDANAAAFAVAATVVLTVF
jgi:hypothetical protein